MFHYPLHGAYVAIGYSYLGMCTLKSEVVKFSMPHLTSSLIIERVSEILNAISESPM